MPRAQSTDFYHMSKFQIVDSENHLNPLAGFATCSSPELTMDIASYRDGINTYTRKQLGNPSFSDITMTKGIIKNDTALADYVKAAAEGGEVRTDFQIYHFHRDDVVGLLEYSKATPSKIIRVFNALPNRIKFASDFDANSSEISMQELGFAIERAEVVTP